VRTHTELRMRTAGLKPSDSSVAERYLYVDISVLRGVFDVQLSLIRDGHWSTPDNQVQSGFVIVWTKSIMGASSLGDAVILETLDKLLDVFLNAYLKANQRQ